MNLLKTISKFFYTPSIKFSKHQNTPSTVRMSNRQALNAALFEQIEANDNVFLIGEQVAQYQGAYKISKGLWQKFGNDRIWDTPISEMAFTGIAIGASQMGLIPIVEFMTMNFSLQAIDQIINSLVKTHYMSGGQLKSTVVIRGLNGPAAAVAAQHSQCFASFFSNIPGLVTIAPYDAEDCKGLLKSAIRGNNPVVFLENQNLYGEFFEVSSDVLRNDFVVPIGYAKVMRQGQHVTVVSFSRSVHYSLLAAEQLEKQGIFCEVVNLRTIKPMDRNCIIKSTMKTGRVVTVEDGFPQSGIGAQICAIINETKAFDYLLGPIQRVTAMDIPMPYSKNLEEMTVPQTDSIIKAIRKVIEYD